MCNPKVQAFFVVACYALFVYFLFSGNMFLASSFSALILPLITLGYFCTVKNKSIYFVFFLILYSTGDLLTIALSNFPVMVNYYLCNSLYIMAYTALVIEIARSLNFKHVLKHYKFSITVLFILNVYISYQLLQIVTPDHSLDSLFFMEMSYNIVILLILSFALLNYFNKDSRKAFYILIGALCLVFAEVLNVAYLYVSKQNLLNLLTISLGLIGFYFLYEQAKLKYKTQNQSKALY